MRRVLYRVSVSVPFEPKIPIKYSPAITLDNPVMVIVTTPLALNELGEKVALAPIGNPKAEKEVVPAPDWA